MRLECLTPSNECVVGCAQVVQKAHVAKYESKHSTGHRFQIAPQTNLQPNSIDALHSHSSPDFFEGLVPNGMMWVVASKILWMVVAFVNLPFFGFIGEQSNIPNFQPPTTSHSSLRHNPAFPNLALKSHGNFSGTEAFGTWNSGDSNLRSPWTYYYSHGLPCSHLYLTVKRRILPNDKDIYRFLLLPLSIPLIVSTQNKKKSPIRLPRLLPTQHNRKDYFMVIRHQIIV